MRLMNQDEVWVGPHHKLGVELRKSPQRRLHNVVRAQAAEQLPHKRGRARRIRPRADFVIHAQLGLQWPHAVCGGLNIGVHGANQRVGVARI